MTFHDKNNFSPKKGYYTCEYCNYYSTNTGKLKQHEVLHTQEWEALIEAVATAEVDENGDNLTQEVEMSDDIKSDFDSKTNEANEMSKSIYESKDLHGSNKKNEMIVDNQTNHVST